MQGEVVKIDPARRRELDAERERIRAMARGGRRAEAPEAPDAFPQPLEVVMAIQDPAARHEAALEHMRILCRNIRAKEGVHDLKTSHATLSAKAQMALDTSVNVFRRTRVLSESELDAFLATPEEPTEQLQQAA